MIMPVIGHKIYAEFDHYPEDGLERFKSGIVFKITRRFGNINDGHNPQNDLVHIIQDDGSVDQFDAGYIVKREKPTNYVDYSSFNPSIEISRVVGIDYLMAEINKLMTNTRVTSIPNIDQYRMMDDAVKMGLFLSVYGFNIKPKNKKRFKKWVKQNVNRYIEPKKYVDKRMTQYHMEVERDYWNDIEDDWLDNMDEAEDA